MTRAINFFPILLTTIVLVSCEPDPVGQGGGGEVPISIWQSSQSFTAPPQAEYESYLIRYFVLNPDGSCLILWTSDKDFHWVHTGRFDGVSSVVSTDGSTRELTFNRVQSTIGYFGQTFVPSQAADEVAHWIDTLNVTHLVSLPIPDDGANYPYYGFGFDGVNVYTASSREVLRLSSAGTVLTRSPLPPADSLSKGYYPYVTGMTLSGSHVWLSTMWNIRYQRLFRLDPTSLQVFDSRAINIPAGEISSIAVVNGGSTLWAQAHNWLGGATNWLYRVDLTTGQQTDSVHFLSNYSTMLGWHDGSLWSYKVISSAYDLSEVLYLHAVNPLTGRTTRSVKLVGFPNRSNPPFFPTLCGIVFLDSGVYLLDAHGHSVWKGILATQ